MVADFENLVQESPHAPPVGIRFPARSSPEPPSAEGPLPPGNRSGWRGPLGKPGPGFWGPAPLGRDADRFLVGGRIWWHT